MGAAGAEPLVCLVSLTSRPPCCARSEAAAHAVATLAEATLQGGGQIVLSGETAAAVGALTGVQDANGKAAGPEGFSSGFFTLLLDRSFSSLLPELSSLHL